jgi:ferric-dicitrate binding protein FerR (iron transport regulator)
LLFDRPDGAGADGFVVRTPFAIIAARGTEFFVGPDVRPDKAGIEIFVQRGVVTVRNNAGRVQLGAGEGTSVSSPDAAPEDPRPWGAPRIAAAYERVGEPR